MNNQYRHHVFSTSQPSALQYNKTFCPLCWVGRFVKYNSERVEYTHLFNVFSKCVWERDGWRARGREIEMQPNFCELKAISCTIRKMHCRWKERHNEKNVLLFLLLLSFSFLFFLYFSFFVFNWLCAPSLIVYYSGHVTHWRMYFPRWFHLFF